MEAAGGCWDGRLSEGRRRRRRGGRGERGGGSANYTEQLWGLLKSRMKQRAAEASAADGTEEPEHCRELQLAASRGTRGILQLWPAPGTASTRTRRGKGAGGPEDVTVELERDSGG